MDMVAILDMQTPTLLMGDFNGTVSPERDYSVGEGPVCALLVFDLATSRRTSSRLVGHFV